MLGRKVDYGNANECERVKIESRGKLSNDEKVKFVGSKKSVRLREKTCGPRHIWKLSISILFLNSGVPNRPSVHPKGPFVLGNGVWEMEMGS